MHKFFLRLKFNKILFFRISYEKEKERTKMRTEQRKFRVVMRGIKVGKKKGGN